MSANSGGSRGLVDWVGSRSSVSSDRMFLLDWMVAGVTSCDLSETSGVTSTRSLPTSATPKKSKRLYSGSFQLLWGEALMNPTTRWGQVGARSILDGKRAHH